MGATVLPQLADVHREVSAVQPQCGIYEGRLASGGWLSEWLDYCEDLVFDFALLKKYRHLLCARSDRSLQAARLVEVFLQQYYSTRAATAKQTCG